ncbi:hypothetical protein STEG23_023233 [Scotinomys teguina]
MLTLAEHMGTSIDWKSANSQYNTVWAIIPKGVTGEQQVYLIDGTFLGHRMAGHSFKGTFWGTSCMKRMYHRRSVFKILFCKTDFMGIFPACMFVSMYMPCILRGQKMLSDTLELE